LIPALIGNNKKEKTEKKFFTKKKRAKRKSKLTTPVTGPTLPATDSQQESPVPFPGPGFLAASSLPAKGKMATYFGSVTVS
jgi:hypothetical protein